MLLNLLELRKNTTNKLKNKDGSILFLGVFAVVALIVLVFLIFDTNNKKVSYRLITDTVKDCLMSAGADNLFESFQPHRDANVGSFAFDGVEFVEIQNTSAFMNRLSSDFDVEFKNDAITSLDSLGNVVFKISDVRLFVDNLTAQYAVEYDLTLNTLEPQGQRQVVKYQKNF